MEVGLALRVGSLVCCWHRLMQGHWRYFVAYSSASAVSPDGGQQVVGGDGLLQVVLRSQQGGFLRHAGLGRNHDHGHRGQARHLPLSGPEGSSIHLRHR